MSFSDTPLSKFHCQLKVYKWRYSRVYQVSSQLLDKLNASKCSSRVSVNQLGSLCSYSPSTAYAFPLTSVQVNCNYNFLSWVTLFWTLIALINLMYLVATWTRLLWLGILLGVLFLRLAMTEATAMTSLGRHDTSSARRSRPHHKNIPQCLLVHQCLVSSWTVSSCLSRLWF